MITSNVIKGIHELLEEHGIDADQTEPLGETVARALGISAHQSEVLLESLHDGASLDQAVAAAHIEGNNEHRELLVRIARVIGTALGKANRS